jgi:glucokinase
MARMLQLGDEITSEEVYKLAASGNEKAQMVFRTVGTMLGIAIGNLINIFNFPLYLLSGGVVAGWDQFAPAMMAEIEKRSYTFRHVKTRVEKATLGNEAGLFGAAYLPFQTPRSVARQ